jgi:hypothetical protein
VRNAFEGGTFPFRSGMFGCGAFGSRRAQEKREDVEYDIAHVMDGAAADVQQDVAVFKSIEMYHLIK